MDWSALIGQFLPWLLALGGTALGIKFWQQVRKIFRYIGEFHDILDTAAKAYENDGKIDTAESIEIIKQYNEFVVVIGKPQWQVKI